MQHLGPYELLDVIGQGGMGRVWRARDRRYGRVVALKVIAGGEAQEADYLKLFRREADLVGRMNSPHIVPIHNYGEIDGQAYLDMRHVDGDSLSGVVRRYGPASLATAIEIVSQAASALDDAHAAGVVHRDVKPANLLLDRKGFVYLADFGIAVVDRHKMAAGSQILGSWAYMAPERFGSSEDSPAVDVYALGCVLFYALTGEPPFPGRGLEELRAAHREARAPSLVGKIEGVTPRVDAAIRWALRKDPAERPESAGQWVEAIKKERRRAAGGQSSLAASRTARTSVPARKPSESSSAGRTSSGKALVPRTPPKAPSSDMSFFLLAVLVVLVIVAVGLGFVVVDKLG